AVDRVAVGVLDLDCELAGRRVKDLELAVLGRRPAAAGEQAALRREGQADNAVGEAGEPVLDFALRGVPNDDLLEAAGGEQLAVWRVGERLDERQVRRGDRLAISTDELRIDETADVLARRGFVDIDLVAAAGGDFLLVGADGDGAHRGDVRGRNAQRDLRLLP